MTIYAQQYIGTNKVYLRPDTDRTFLVQGINQDYEPQCGIQVWKTDTKISYRVKDIGNDIVILYIYEILENRDKP